MIRDTAITNIKAAASAVVAGWDGDGLSAIFAQYFARAWYKICHRLRKITMHECK